MTKNYQLVPIQVSGLFLDEGRNGVEAMADFSHLPYVGQHDGIGLQDVHADRPFTSNKVVTEPLNDSNFWLKPGVHLHWQMPQALTTATHPVDENNQQQNREKLAFPALPNRWLVCRWLGGVFQKSWVVESDFVWPADTHWQSAGQQPSDLVTYPMGIEQDDAQARRFVMLPGQKPYRYLGRCWELGKKPALPAQPDYLRDLGTPLTVLGYGEQTFASFYPNCRSAFGLHDDTQPVAKDLWYEVFGWYSHEADDPFYRFIRDNDPQGVDVETFVDRYEANFGRLVAFKWDETLIANDAQNKHELSLLASADEPDTRTKLLLISGQLIRGKSAFIDVLKQLLSDAEFENHKERILALAMTDTPEVLFQNQLAQRFNWTWDKASKPDRLLCYGQVARPGFVPPAQRDSAGLKVSVANSGSEALSAFLSKELAAQRYPDDADEQRAEKKRIENHLEALLLSKTMEGKKLDIGAILMQERHTKSFTAHPGASVWSIHQQRQSDGGAIDVTNPMNQSAVSLPSSDADIELPIQIAHLLNRLNNLEQAYFKGRHQVEALQQQLYFDWYRYMDNCYPDSDEVRDYLAVRGRYDTEHDVDVIIDFIKRRSLGDLHKALQATGEVVSLASNRCQVRYFAPLPAAGYLGSDSAADPSSVIRLRDLDLIHNGEGWQSKSGKTTALESILAQKIGAPDGDAPAALSQSIDRWAFQASDGTRTLFLQPGSEQWHRSSDSGTFSIPLSLAQSLATTWQDLYQAIESYNIDPMEATYTEVIHRRLTSMGVSETILTALKEGLLNKTFSRQTGQTVKAALTSELIAATGLASNDSLIEKIWQVVHPPWELTRAPGPRFWEPNDPVVLLSKNGVKASERWQDNKPNWVDSDGKIQCRSFQTPLLDLDELILQPEPAVLIQGAVRSSLDQLAKELDMTNHNPGHLHPFLLEWQVEIAPVRQQSNMPADDRAYEPDFIQTGWTLNETEFELTEKPSPDALANSVSSFRGRSVLLSHANAQLREQLERYILRRLRQPVLTGEGQNKKQSYFQQIGIDVTDGQNPDQKVQQETKQKAYIREHLPAIRRWVVRVKDQQNIATAMSAWQQFKTTQYLGSITDRTMVYGLPDAGPIAQGIVHLINAHNQSDAFSFFQNDVGLSSAVSYQLAERDGITLNSLVQLEQYLQSSSEPFIRLLRYADAHGYINGPEAPSPQSVYAHPMVQGLPDGGGLASAMLAVVNTLSATANGTEQLIKEVGLRPEAAQAMHRTRQINPFQSLSDLDSLPQVTVATWMHLLVYTNSKGNFNGLTLPLATTFSWQDEYGHHWVDPLLTAFDSWNYLHNYENLLTQSLAGFNDAMLMKRRGWQLPVADPLAFDQYRSFTEMAIRQAVAGQGHHSPLILNDFHPIRSGEMGMTYLRLVDSFGQIIPVDISDLTTTAAMTSERNLQVTLPPRITQPARLNLRWLASDDDNQGGDDIEWNSHPAVTPICGWLVADNLEVRLNIFDNQGRLLGVVDRFGRWRTPPHRLSPETPEDISNPHLKIMVQYLRDQGEANRSQSPTFVERFVNLLETAQERIDPESFQHQHARALLLSRPLSLVRARVDLQLRDPYAIRQSMTAFGRELKGSARTTSDFEQVKFPLRVGEHQRFQDGVAGYWVENATGNFRANDFYAPQSDWQPSTDGLHIYRKKDIDFNIGLSLTDEPVVISVLMDPRASLHASCGVLPGKALSIPPDQYVPAMEKMEVYFQAAPILTPRNRVQTYVLDDPDWEWSWIANRDGNWETLSEKPQITQSDFFKAFPKRQTLWESLHQLGILKARGNDPRVAQVDLDAVTQVLDEQAKVGETLPMTLPRDLNPSLKESLAVDIDNLKRFLQTSHRRLTKPDDMALFAPQELREGWLRQTKITSENG